MRHRADQVRLPVHGMGPNTQDINWLFVAPKLKTPPCSLWKNILGAWLSVRPSLCKSESTNTVELLRQLVFGNPLISNQESKPLGLSSRSKGNAFASAGCSKVRDFWDPESQDWKGLFALGVSFHPINKQNKDLIIASIPWNPATSNSRPQVGDWVSKREARRNASPKWVYQIIETTLTTASAREFRRSSPASRIQATNTQNIIIPLKGYTPVRVLAQEGHGATLRLAKDLLPPGKKTPHLLNFRNWLHL